MKRLIALLSPLLYFISPKLAFASNTLTPHPTGTTLNLCPDGAYKAFCQLNSGNFGPIIGTVIIIMFIISIVIALIWLVIGGMKWITSSGDSTKVEGARNQIIAAVIGLIIVFLSFFILNFVLGMFNLSLMELTIPVLPGFEKKP